MKRALFKGVCFILFWCGIAQLATAQGIVVNKKDGTKVYFKASEVLNVGVYGYGEGPETDPDSDPQSGVLWVDLGLPSGTLWATMNVGAEKPEDYGDYFAWGETQPKNKYDWSTYKYCNGSENNLTKYCIRSSDGKVDNKTELETTDDAATVNWGEEWQMPSLEQMKEIINSNYTTSTWTTQNGVKGTEIKSKINGNSIFIPAAGTRSDMTLNDEGRRGDYWARSLYTSDSDFGHILYFLSDYFAAGAASTRYYGKSVRPVRVKK